MRKIFCLSVSFLWCVSSYAQDFKMGYTAPSVAPAYRNVALQVEGVDRTTPSSPVPKGVLIATMSSAERNTISTTTSPAGLLVYDTDVQAFFFLKPNQFGNNDWVQIASETGSSVLTDTSLSFTGTNNVFINSITGTLQIQKGGTTFIQIPQGAGATTDKTGIVITDGSSGTAFTGSVLTLNAANKGFLLPRVASLSNIPNPPFGLMAILQTSTTNTPNAVDGVYVNMSGNPLSPTWKKIALEP